MGMILRIASSRIVGQGDIVGRSGYFSLNLSANSVMRGRLDARRTLKSLVADLRVNNLMYRIQQCLVFVKYIYQNSKHTNMKIRYRILTLCLQTTTIFCLLVSFIAFPYVIRIHLISNTQI